MTKIRVLVIFGGRSFEHRVSLDSAEWVLSWLNPDKYDVSCLGILRSGECVAGPQALTALVQEAGGYTGPDDIGFLNQSVNVCKNIVAHVEAFDAQPDVIFSLIHGAHGEDGRLQWMFDLLWIPYVGSGVSGSAICMDKIITKNILENNEIRQLPYFGTTLFEWRTKPQEVRNQADFLWYPIFIKPANGCSSIGISKVKDAESFTDAMERALIYDSRILIEKALESPRELEVAALGNDDVFISYPGENIVSERHEFYTYEAKYIDENSNFVQIPAQNITDEIVSQIQKDAKKAFYAVNAKWIARIDFFVDRITGFVYLNEINTLPEFTRSSVYPKLLESKERTFEDIIDRLIQLAFENK